MDLSRRDLLLEEMLAELAREGYAESSVTTVMRVAGMSEDEFSAAFEDKDDCLFTAYERAGDKLVHRASAGCEESGGDWPARVRAGLCAVLEEIAAKPAQAAAMTRAFPGIGPRAYARYSNLLSRFAKLMVEGRECSGIGDELPDEVELLAVGAGESLIFAEIDAGRTGALPAMMPEILFSILVPFIGPDRAADEMRQATTAL